MTGHRQQAPRWTPLRLPARVALGLKRACAALAQAMLFKAPRDNADRVAVYRIGSIGDHLAALAAMAAIRRLHPRAELHLLTNSPGEWPARLGLTEALNLKVYAYDSPAALGQAVRAVQPQVLYYLAPYPTGLRRALRDALFFRWQGVRRAAGFATVDATGWAARALRPRWQAMAEHERLLRACGLGDPGPLQVPLTSLPLALAEPFVVLAPTGKTPVQHWPGARWLELARRLVEAGVMPVWAGDEADRLRLAGHELPGHAALLGRAALAEVCGALKHARAFVGNDSGLAHLAALCGTPAIVVSSARAAAGAWTPRCNGAAVRVLRKDMNCEGCRREACPDTACLEAISVDEVVQALRGLGALLPTT